MDRHHIDKDYENLEPDNLLYLDTKDHRRLHARAYDYLVEIGKVKEYVKWCVEKYGMRLYTKDEYLEKLKYRKATKQQGDLTNVCIYRKA